MRTEERKRESEGEDRKKPEGEEASWKDGVVRLHHSCCCESEPCVCDLLALREEGGGGGGDGGERGGRA